jgi:hypothetical protein
MPRLAPVTSTLRGGRAVTVSADPVVVSLTRLLLVVVRLRGRTPRHAPTLADGPPHVVARHHTDARSGLSHPYNFPGPLVTGAA